MKLGKGSPGIEDKNLFTEMRYCLRYHNQGGDFKDKCITILKLIISSCRVELISGSGVEMDRDCR